MSPFLFVIFCLCAIIPNCGGRGIAPFYPMKTPDYRGEEGTEYGNRTERRQQLDLHGQYPRGRDKRIGQQKSVHHTFLFLRPLGNRLGIGVCHAVDTYADGVGQGVTGITVTGCAFYGAGRTFLVYVCGIIGTVHLVDGTLVPVPLPHAA